MFDSIVSILTLLFIRKGKTGSIKRLCSFKNSSVCPGIGPKACDTLRQKALQVLKYRGYVSMLY